MVLPAILAGISTAMGIGSQALQFLDSARGLETEAKNLRKTAATTVEGANRQIGTMALGANRLLGAQRGALGAAGVSADFGSPVAFQSQQLEETAMERKLILSDAWKTAQALRSSARRKRRRGRLRGRLFERVFTSPTKLLGPLAPAALVGDLAFQKRRSAEHGRAEKSQEAYENQNLEDLGVI